MGRVNEAKAAWEVSSYPSSRLSTIHVIVVMPVISRHVELRGLVAEVTEILIGYVKALMEKASLHL